MNGIALAPAPAITPAKAALDAADLSPAGLKALYSLELALAPVLRDRQLAETVAQETAVHANWVPYVPPAEPEDMWDVAIDAYGTRVLPLYARSAA